MTSFTALDGVTSFLRLKDVTITCKRIQRSLSISRSSSVQWRKVGRSWGLQTCVCRLLCVRIEMDQLQFVNCWLIIHCLSVSCTKINHSRWALVIWSSLQLTSKQWIITQQFTAGADLFLKFRVRLAPLNRFKPSSKIFYWPFQGGSSFVDLLCFCSLLCLLCLCKPVLSSHTRRPKIVFPDKLSLSEGFK